MKMSKMLISTLKEVPSDAEITSSSLYICIVMRGFLFIELY